MNWKLSHSGPALVLSSGHCWYADRKPEGVYLENMREAIGQYPGKESYTFSIERMVKLGDAVQRNRIDELGTLKPHRSTVFIAGARQKRKFEYAPRTGQELIERQYRSIPFEVKE